MLRKRVRSIALEAKSRVEEGATPDRLGTGASVFTDDYSVFRVREGGGTDFCLSTPRNHVVAMRKVTPAEPLVTIRLD